MKKIIVFLFSFLLFIKGNGQEFSVLNIPDSLIVNADIVVRKDITKVEQLSENKLVVKYNVVFTILNENGLDYASFNAYEDGFTKLKFVKGEQFDKFGISVKKIGKKDLQTSTLSSNFKGDDKRYFYDFEIQGFPFTVEFEYVKEISSNFFLHNNYFIPGFGVAVQKSIFEYNSSIPNQFVFEENHFGSFISKKIEQNGALVSWELNNFKAIKEEPLSTDKSIFLPHLLISPVSFELDGYKGKMDSWENFGNFIAQLNQNRQEISLELKNKMQSIKGAYPNKKEQAKKIYEYVQQNYRYVSIQLGIGGWQPIPAMEVEINGFGDCKGLSNLTHSLLKEVGIKSNYVLVGAGNNEFVEKNFPNNSFNHIILQLPFENDTTWLECTSHITPFGYLGDFTSNRDVLVIDKKPYLGHTPKYTAEVNSRITNCKLEVDLNHNVLVNFNVNFKGQEYDDIIGNILGGKEDMKKYVYDKISSQGLNIQQYNINEIRNSIPEIEITAILDSKDFIKSTTKRIFIPTSIMKSKINNLIASIENDRNRITPFIIDHSWSQTDSVFIESIESKELEEQITKTVVITEFGKLNYHTEITEKGILFIRHFELNEGIFPPIKFNDFYEFISKSNKVFNKTIILKKTI